ncbi:hypothetical protein BD311DRAFT_862659 [Dichomitus squalens]|uniref:MIT domain-containing protein n=1 Tax=Dichomitus squalens TaxID=114155 RepID=A0A4Q9MX33_9APHY|nr:hypothetical protein BD311DRAFT_862659 [Dichomitus squalens]
MAPMDSPLNAAHQHAANADDYLARGLLIPAAEEHYKAAEAFQACVDASNDDNTKRTLRMLHNEHMKMGKDLQRRIAKLREENKDPSLPQKPPRVPAAGPSTSVSPPSPQPPSSPPPPQPQNKLSDSQQTVDESFMLLGQRSDPGDAFHQFWKATEGMLEYLSRPVAFATAPLAPQESNLNSNRNGSWSSDTDLEDPISKKISRGISLVKAAHSRMLTRYDSPATGSDTEAAPGPSVFPPPPQPSHAFDIRDDWDDDVRAFEDDDMADSFCLVPSKSEPGVASLKEENASLKAELEKQRQQLVNMEAALKARQEQDQQLRDSIMLARKEAHRAMLSSTVVARPTAVQPPVDIASLNLTVPVPPPVPAAVAAANNGRERDPQLVRRVRELEEEVRNLRSENEKQKAMIVRFRERWEKLKESAKRKKEAKAAAETTNVVGQRIEEDPEAEAAAERDEAGREDDVAFA